MFSIFFPLLLLHHPVDEVYANDRRVDYYSGRELWPRLSLEEGNGRLISV